MSVRAKQGFTLVEAMIAIAILLIFASGVYGGIRLVFQVVYQSRLRILESAILNEQVEIVRNMSFFDVGIVNGSPSGLLERNVTTTRNGIDFLITRTIRNIDDPFDGTIGGTPNDTAPADYKLVDISIICTACAQREPLVVSTFAGPKYLEGNPDNGALFIEVIDASGQPVQGATVRLVSTSTDPTYDFEDTTGNDGFLRVVDLAAGQNAYHITVTKDGYTRDMTTTSVANPTKPPASVVAQDVTSRTFSIDVVSTLNIETKTAVCAPIAAADGQIAGSRVIGTEPDSLLIDTTFTTDGDGAFTFADMPWDTYSLIPTGYDLVGAIPMLPLEMLPGSETDLSLILGPSTADSLLVHVEDSSTGDPVSSSTVTIVEGGSTFIRTTGIGTLRQLSWIGGAGQSMYTDETRYAADDGNLTIGADIELVDLSGAYVSDGWLESSTFDLGGSTNFVSLDWGPYAQPAQTGTSSVRLQFASSNSSTPASWNFLGPDGTNSTYYTPELLSINDVHNGDQFARYRVYLSTASSSYTPTVSDVAFTYVAQCTPPGQAYFGGISDETYTITVSSTGYTSYVSEVTVDGATRLIVPLVAE